MNDWRGAEVTVGCTVLWPIDDKSIRVGTVLQLDPFTVHIEEEMWGWGGKKAKDYFLPKKRDAILARPDRVTVVQL